MRNWIGSDRLIVTFGTSDGGVGMAKCLSDLIAVGRNHDLISDAHG